jgi:hypothetical protein
MAMRLTLSCQAVDAVGPITSCDTLVAHASFDQGGPTAHSVLHTDGGGTLRLLEVWCFSFSFLPIMFFHVLFFLFLLLSSSSCSSSSSSFSLPYFEQEHTWSFYPSSFFPCGDRTHSFPYCCFLLFVVLPLLCIVITHSLFFRFMKGLRAAPSARNVEWRRSSMVSCWIALLLTLTSFEKRKIN